MSGLQPEHPAASTAFDEVGRSIHLYPTERTARLECLKLAITHGEPPEAVVRRAEAFAAFVLGTASVGSTADERKVRPLPNVHNLDARVGTLEAKVDDALRKQTIAERWKVLTGQADLQADTTKASDPSGPATVTMATAEQVAHDFQCAGDYSRRSNELLARGIAGLDAMNAKAPERPALSAGGHLALTLERIRVEGAFKDAVQNAEACEREAANHRDASDMHKRRLDGIQRDLGEAPPS